MLHKIIYKNFKSNIRKYILFFVSNIIAVAELFIFWGLNDVVVRAVEYSCAVTPQIRQTGNRLSGNAGTAYASLLA